MDYANGKIYMLEPTCEYDEGDVYYGSTTSTLVKRLSGHKSISNKTRSLYLMEKYGRANIKIVLVKLFPCSSKDELNAEEGTYHRKNKCVNKNIAGRTDKEYREETLDKMAEWRKENREATRQYNKAYQKANRETLREYNREYHRANREKINAQARKNHARRREEQKAQ